MNARQLAMDNSALQQFLLEEFPEALNDETAINAVIRLLKKAKGRGFLPAARKDRNIAAAGSGSASDQILALLPERPVPGDTIFVFASGMHAEKYGFRGTSHPIRPDFRAHWAGLPENSLYGRIFQTVIIMCPRGMTGSLEHLLRHRQRPYGNTAIWIET